MQFMLTMRFLSDFDVGLADWSSQPNPQNYNDPTETLNNSNMSLFKIAILGRD